MKEKLFKKEITRRLFSVVLALAMVVALVPATSIPVMAATYTSSGSGIFYEGNGNWSVENRPETSWAKIQVGDVLSGMKYTEYSSEYTRYICCDGVANALTKGDIVSGTVVKIEGESRTIYICTAADHEAKKDTTTGLCTTCNPDKSQPKTGVMDTLPVWFGVMAVSAAAYVLTSKKRFF